MVLGSPFHVPAVSEIGMVRVEFLVGFMASGHYDMTETLFSVERRGLEPRTSGCKPEIFPLELPPLGAAYEN